MEELTPDVFVTPTGSESSAPSSTRSTSPLVRGRAQRYLVPLPKQGTVFSAFGKVLGIQDMDLIRNIVGHLNQAVSTRYYFIELIKKLPLLTVNENRRLRLAKANGSFDDNAIEYKIGKGSYGSVYLSEKGYIYKEIRIDSYGSYDSDSMEYELRTIFLETFIQTVLGYDLEMALYIPKIYNIYRTRKNDIIYIVMEHIPKSLNSYLDTLYKDKGPIMLYTIGKLFYDISTILSNLFARYKFFHKDLHGGNIMLTDINTVKIIDFGMSCLTYEGVTYSISKSNVGYETPRQEPCLSFDLLILSSWLVQYKNNTLALETLQFLNNVMTSDSGVNFYSTIQKDKSDPNYSIFHMMYMNKINKWPSTLRNELFNNSRNLEPMGFKRLLLQRLGKSEDSYRKMSPSGRMAKTRKHRGGGFQTPQQMFDPAVLPPSTLIAAPSGAPTADFVRPIQYSTFQTGGARKVGGFSPSIMGGFVANAQAAIVPLALYAVYHTFVPKKGAKGTKKGGRRANRKNRSRKH